MKTFFFGFILGLCAGAILIGAFFFLARMASGISREGSGIGALFAAAEEEKKRQEEVKTQGERIKEAHTRSRGVKALYMTADVARADNLGGRLLRQNLITLAERTEINGLVIDVKEVCGPDYDPDLLRALLDELHQKNIWVIARITVFKDASQIEAHPEWYLSRKAHKPVAEECASRRHLRVKSSGEQQNKGVFWRDRRGGYWLDPASEGAQEYIIDFAKKIAGVGFDELQFDYIRFPSDGDVESAIYPSWDRRLSKYMVLKNFFRRIRKELKEYKPEIILSADLFGYVATRLDDSGIGQRLEDIGDSFDYVSFMVYPSHYYNGFELPADTARGLPAVRYDFAQARAHPDVVVGRSLLFARDALDGKAGTSSSATSSLAALAVKGGEGVSSGEGNSRVRFRPWLEDFFHEEDKKAGRPFGVQKVRMQIEAAEQAGARGWLLWNAANVYTEGALTP